MNKKDRCQTYVLAAVFLIAGSDGFFKDLSGPLFQKQILFPVNFYEISFSGNVSFTDKLPDTTIYGTHTDSRIIRKFLSHQTDTQNSVLRIFLIPVRKKAGKTAGTLQKEKISAAAGLFKKIFSHQLGVPLQSSDICLHPMFKFIPWNLYQGTRRNGL